MDAQWLIDHSSIVGCGQFSKRTALLKKRDAARVPERMLARTMGGSIVRLPTKCHNEGDDKPVGVIRSIRRHFKLTPADGVSDREFYGRA
jgi:hypothetical protein